MPDDLDLVRALFDLKQRVRDLERVEFPVSTGTFASVTLVGSTTPGTFTYDTGNTEAQYTRVGDRVLFNGRVNITATSVAPVGNISIAGLPFPSGANAANGNILGGCNIAWSGINLAAGYTEVEGVIVGATSSILLYELGDNVARAIVQGSEIAAAVDIWFWGMYKL